MRALQLLQGWGWKWVLLSAGVFVLAVQTWWVGSLNNPSDVLNPLRSLHQQILALATLETSESVVVTTTTTTAAPVKKAPPPRWRCVDLDLCQFAWGGQKVWGKDGENQCNYYAIKGREEHQSDYLAGGQTPRLCLKAYEDETTYDVVRNAGVASGCQHLTGIWNHLPCPPDQPDCPRDSYMDVGANIGQCLFPMMARPDVRQVFALEGLETNIFYLTSTVLVNPHLREKITIFKAKVGGKRATLKTLVTGGAALVVNVVTLDGIFMPAKRLPPYIHMVRLDMQGEEMKVLRGARSLLEAGAVGAWVFTAAEALLRPKGASVAQVFSILIETGYAVYDLSAPRTPMTQGELSRYACIAVQASRLFMATKAYGDTIQREVDCQGKVPLPPPPPPKSVFTIPKGYKVPAPAAPPSFPDPAPSPGSAAHWPAPGPGPKGGAGPAPPPGPPPDSSPPRAPAPSVATMAGPLASMGVSNSAPSPAAPDEVMSPAQASGLPSNARCRGPACKFLWSGSRVLGRDEAEAGKLSECRMSTMKEGKYLGLGQPPELCLRSYFDSVSTPVREQGIWHECPPLAELWDLAQCPPERPACNRNFYLDIGPSIGVCLAMMLARPDVAHVIAFEPSLANLFYLTNTLLANKGFGEKATIFPLALGDKAAKHAVIEEKGVTINTTLDIPSRSDDPERIKTLGEVEAVTLDSVLIEGTKPPPYIHLCNLDVLGFEAAVLRGAKHVLRMGAVGTWKFKIMARMLAMQGSSTLEVFQVFLSNGYYLFDEVGMNALENDQLRKYACKSKFLQRLFVATLKIPEKTRKKVPNQKLSHC